jgi:hypothetical protein
MNIPVAHKMHHSTENPISISNLGIPAPPTGMDDSVNTERSLQLQKLGFMDQKEFHDCRNVIASTVDDACLASIRNFQVMAKHTSLTLPQFIIWSDLSTPGKWTIRRGGKGFGTSES